MLRILGLTMFAFLHFSCSRGASNKDFTGTPKIAVEQSLGDPNVKEKSDNLMHEDEIVIPKKVESTDANKPESVVSQSADDPMLKTQTVAIDNRTLGLSDHKLFKDLKAGENQFEFMCSQSSLYQNRVVTAFCTNKLRPKSLIELQEGLGLGFKNPNNPTTANNINNARGLNGVGGNPAFAIQGHSSSLVGRFVSPLNPRVIIISPELLGNNSSNPQFLVMGFVRGEQLVELAAKDSKTNQVEFYLLSFKQACNGEMGGCKAYQLQTPMVESNWTEVTVFHSSQLENTIGDCTHCHKPVANQPAMLRMQELRNPWTHWFRDNTAGNELIDQYYAAHAPTEIYGGIPGGLIRGSDPQKLENLVRGNGFTAQPNEFLTQVIQQELANTPGMSATWNLLYEGVVAGKFIPIPFPSPNVTDPNRRATFTKQYVDFMAGVLPAEDFKDHTDIFPQDPVKRAQIGIAVSPTAPAREILMVACSQCHISRLKADGINSSPNLSKLKFDVSSLESIALKDPDVISRAIERLKLGYSIDRLKQENIVFKDANGNPMVLEKGEHLLTMPPRRIRELTDVQIDTLIEYLKTFRK